MLFADECGCLVQTSLLCSHVTLKLECHTCVIAVKSRARMSTSRGWQHVYGWHGANRKSSTHGVFQHPHPENKVIYQY